MINQYLMQLSKEAGQQMYNLLGFLQYPAYIGMLIFATKKYHVPVKHKIILWLGFAVSMMWGDNIIPVLSDLTNGIIPKINMGVSFAFVVLIMTAIMYSLHIPVLFSLDVIVPTFVLGRGLAIIGCIFTGCCHGFSMPQGIYSSAAGTFTFPTVVLDSVASCFVVIYLMFLANKQNYTGNGIVAAKGMILFGLIRFLVDILRDNQKLIFLLTAEGFFGIAYIFAGYLILSCINKRGVTNGI